jgi:acetolactate decarboxylase
MKQIFLSLLVSGLLFSCHTQENKKSVSQESKSDKIYQYSVFTALANKIYDGTTTVADIKKKGNTGLGTYNGLNGEMIVCDGVFYQWLANGTVQIPEDSELVPFAVVTFFEIDQTFNIPLVGNYEEMKTLIETKLPSKNLGYAFKIYGNFETLKCASANKQEKPFTKTISNALINRPTFDMENVNGTLVGFWYPEYVGKINVTGFHLHFISDDKKQAGHVLDFKANKLKIDIDYCDGFNVELVNTEAFKNADFDLSQEYNTRK